jgi:hypothetical protein
MTLKRETPMDLSPELLRSIESTHVAFEGLSHPLRCVGAELDGSGHDETKVVNVTVEAAHNGEPRRATCRFDMSRLDDERHVAISLAETMREVLAGELEPGRVRDSE